MRTEPEVLHQATDHLCALARHLQSEPEPIDVLRLLVDAAVDEIPGAERASVTLLNHGRSATPVRTDDLAAELDAAQYELNEGPCLEAAAGKTVVRSDDLSTDRRWPEFGRHARELDVHSVLSLRLWVEGVGIGALNVYARPESAFSPTAEEIGIPLATHAAIAIVSTRKTANLEIALGSRDVIGQAKGILMERFKIGPDQAFELLVTASQRNHLKLRDLAGHLARTGELLVPDPQDG